MSKEAVRVLVVEDDYMMANQYKNWIQMLNTAVKVEHAFSIRQALEISDRFMPQIVILDVRLPDGNGLDLLGQKDIDAYFLVITGYPEIKDAVNAIRRGAVDYIDKSELSHKLFLEKVGRLVNIVFYEKQNEAVWRESDHEIFRHFITFDKNLREEILATLELLRKSMKSLGTEDYFPLLILGETGVGKSFLATVFHKFIPLKGKCVRINMPNYDNPHTFESELFGYVKGAFTGADRDKPGLIEDAQNGLLLLDEIGEIDELIQAKLLILLENQTFRRLGETGKERKLKALIIATTNRNIEKLLKEGKFRPDLFYRFRTLKIPPLRERLEDILPLAQKFLADSKRKYQRENLKFSIDAKYAMLRYSWDGNVRELYQLIDTAVYRLGKGKNILEKEDLFPSDTFSHELIVKEPTDETKERLISALKATNCNIQKTAELLRVSRVTVYNRIKKYNLNLSEICKGRKKPRRR